MIEEEHVNLNQKGIDLIKSFEGCNLNAYPDPATGGEPITIGFGSTPLGLKLGTVWTQQQADDALQAELDEKVAGLKKLIKVNLTDNQFSACVSLAYNIGLGNFGGSTLLKLLNAGYGTRSAALEFLKWDHADGKVMAGLLRRREAEKALFETA